MRGLNLLLATLTPSYDSEDRETVMDRTLGSRGFLSIPRLLMFGVLGLIVTASQIGCASTGIRLLVVNKTGGPLQRMTITYAGGSRSFDRLDAGHSYRTRIEVTTLSNLDVEFSLSNGEKKTQNVRAQIEPGYHGDVRLEVTPEGRIGWGKELVKDGSHIPRGTLSPPPPTPAPPRN